MADELRYIVKFEADEASYKALKDKFNDLPKSLPKGGDKPFAPLTRDTEEYGKVLNQTLRKLVELNDQIKNNQGEIKSLSEASKENTAEGLKSAQSLAMLKAENKDLTAEYRTQEAVLNANKNAVEGGAMSYNQMQARVKELGMAMRDMKPVTEENVKAIASMQVESNGLNDKLKAFDKTIGNSQRNVGNYTDSFREAASAIAIFQGPLGPLAGRINALATTLNKISESSKNAKNATGALTTTQKIYNSVMLSSIPLIKANETATKAQAMATVVANSAIKGMNVGLKLFRLALAATGVGALVIALGSLVAFFSAGEKGANALALRMAPLKAIVIVLKNAFVGVGETIVNAFENPKQGITDLVNLIKTNLVNRVTSLGVLFKGLGKVITSVLSFDPEGAKEGFSEIGAGVLQLTTGIEDLPKKMGEFKDVIVSTIKETEDLTTAMQEIVKREREIKVLRAEMNTNMREAMAISVDENKSIEQRLVALQKVMDAEDEMIKAELKFENDKLDIMKRQNAQAESDATDLDAEIEQQVKIAGITQAHHQATVRAQEKINMLNRKGREQELNKLREILTASQRLSDLEIKRVTDDMERKGEMVELAELKLANFKKDLLDEERARFLAYQQEYVNKKFSDEDAIKMATLRVAQELESERLDLDKGVNDAKQARAKALADAQMNINKTQLQIDLDNQIEMFTRRGEHAKAHALNLEKIELDKQAKIDALTEDFVNRGILRTEAEALAKQQIELEIENETKNAKKKLDDAEFAHKMLLLDTFSNLVTTAGGALFKDNKAFAVAGAIMNTYGAIVKTYKELGGTPIGYASAATVGLAGFANVKKILATKKGTKSGSVSKGSAPSANVGTSFGLVDTGTNQSAASFIASQQSMAPQEVNVYLQGEFDPEYLSLKVTQGNNSLAQRTVRIG